MGAEPLNIPAIVAGTIAGFLLGVILYHPRVLGTIWTKGSGVSADDRPPWLAYALQILAMVSLAVVIGVTATVSFLGTALLAILACALFVVSNGAHQRKMTGALLTDGLYVLGAGALMIVMQGVL